MKLHKYSYTSDQCEGRWKTLMRSLKKVTDHNARTGNDLKKHPYEAQLEFIIERPNIKQHTYKVAPMIAPWMMKTLPMQMMKVIVPVQCQIDQQHQHQFHLKRRGLMYPRYWVF